jgi:hypothetical protein
VAKLQERGQPLPPYLEKLFRPIVEGPHEIIEVQPGFDRELMIFDRYEHRALSRRKFA